MNDKIIGATLQEQSIAHEVLRILADRDDNGNVFVLEIRPDIDHPQDWRIDVGVVYVDDDGTADERTFRTTVDPFGNVNAEELN